SIMKGRHSISAGVDYNYIGVYQSAGSDQFGTFTIGGDNTLRILQILSGTAGNNRFDDPSVVYSRQVGGLKFQGNAQQPAFYAQDGWRVSPTFTVTSGVRWEAQINPQPVADNPFLLDNVENFPYPRGHLDPAIIRN